MPALDVIVREVGLRDGLQNVPTFFPTGSKIAWVTAEYEVGVREMQVCSFRRRSFHSSAIAPRLCHTLFGSPI